MEEDTLIVCKAIVLRVFFGDFLYLGEIVSGICLEGGGKNSEKNKDLSEFFSTTRFSKTFFLEISPVVRFFFF